MGRQKYGPHRWERLICWSQTPQKSFSGTCVQVADLIVRAKKVPKLLVWMSTRLTSKVFAELLQMILPRFLSFDTCASFQTPGGQAVSRKNKRQSGKHQVKVFFSDLFWFFTLIDLPHSQESVTPETLLYNYIRQDFLKMKMSDKNRRKWSENLVFPLSNQKGLINIFIISEIANSSSTSAI